MQNKVPLYEIFFVIAIVGCVISLMIVSWYSSQHANFSMSLVSSKIVEVSVQGEIEKPGNYSIVAGDTVAMVLKKAKLTMYSDVIGWDTTRSIWESEMWDIPKLSCLEIMVRGAPGTEGIQTVRVDVGTRVCDLKKVLHITDRRLRQKLKSTRRLKMQDYIDLQE